MELKKGSNILVHSTLVVLFLFFLFLGLSKAQSFFAPFATAMILAMLVLPLARRMEKTFLNRPAASLINTFMLFLISLGFFALLSFQVRSLMKDWPKIKETLEPKIEQAQNFILKHTPIDKKTFNYSPLQSSSSSSMGKKAAKSAASFFSVALGFLGHYLLTFIYVFFMLTYRRRFKKFLLRLFPKDQEGVVRKVMDRSTRVTEAYLLGKLLMIAILAGLYAVGLGVTGVKNFILISLLVAVFDLVPYIGNIIGFGIAIALGYLTSGGSNVLLGIILTFGIAQFVQTYILEPFVVGGKVNLHPFFTIVAVIVGNMVWGIIGMVLSIPLLAILHIIFNNIPSMQPFGYLLGNKEK